MYYASRIAAGVCLVALIWAGWLSMVWARADAAYRQQTPEGLAQALALAPGHRLYASASAIQAEYDGADATPILARIAEQHPRASGPHLQLGLAAEIRGNLEEAERRLLDAYAVDKMFETRWALANFYFRQGREDDFWLWIRRALEISYGDRRPAFELCWRASEDGALILERAIPDRPEVLAGYLWFLLDAQHVAALTDASRKLAAAGGDAAPLYAAIDALLAANRYREGSDVWQAMGHAAVSGVTNGDFARPPLDAGFDWRRMRNEGVTHTPLDAARGYRIRLSGNQPEQVELLRQWLGGLQPAKRYRLRWEISDAIRGVQWRIAGAAAEVSANELAFTAPSEAVLLTLVYARPTGEVRAEAAMDLRRVWLE